MSDSLRRDSAASGMQRRLQPPRCAATAWKAWRRSRTAAACHPYPQIEDKPESYLFSFHSAHPSRDVVCMNAGRRSLPHETPLWVDTSQSVFFYHLLCQGPLCRPVFLLRYSTWASRFGCTPSTQRRVVGACGNHHAGSRSLDFEFFTGCIA